MSQFATALAGAITAAGVGAVTVARYWPRPSGRHRAPRHQPVETPLLRPADALEKVEAHCVAENRRTLHCRLRVTGELVCLDCRTVTPTTHLPTTTPTQEES